MNFTVIKYMGCYILPHLKGFRPRNLQVRRNVYPNIQSSIYSSIKHRHPLSLKKFLMMYEHMQKVCVYVPYLMQRSGGLLIQLTSLMQTMIVPCIHYVCERTLSTHTISTWVHNHSIQMQHPYDNTLKFNHIRMQTYMHMQYEVTEPI